MAYINWPEERHYEEAERHLEACGRDTSFWSVVRYAFDLKEAEDAKRYWQEYEQRTNEDRRPDWVKEKEAREKREAKEQYERNQAWLAADRERREALVKAKAEARAKELADYELEQRLKKLERYEGLSFLCNKLGYLIRDFPIDFAMEFYVPVGKESWPAVLGFYQSDSPYQEWFNFEQTYIGRCYGVFPPLRKNVVTALLPTKPSNTQPSGKLAVECRLQGKSNIQFLLPSTDGYNSDGNISVHLPLAWFLEYPSLTENLIRLSAEGFAKYEFRYIFGDFSENKNKAFSFQLRSPRKAQHVLILAKSTEGNRLPRAEELPAWISQILDYRTETHGRIIHISTEPSFCLFVAELKYVTACSRPIVYGLQEDPATKAFCRHLLREQCYYDWCRYFYPDRIRI